MVLLSISLNLSRASFFITKMFSEHLRYIHTYVIVFIEYLRISQCGIPITRMGLTSKVSKPKLQCIVKLNDRYSN